MGQDDQRPAWIGPAAVAAVVIGIVVVSVVGRNLPHRDDTEATSTSTSTTSTTAPLRADRVSPGSTVEVVPGWEHIGTLPFRSDDALVVDTGQELIVINGGRNLSSLPPSTCGHLCDWVGVAIDHDTLAMRDLPPSPMCNAGTPAGIWTGDMLIVWSSTSLGSLCPLAAAYSPATDEWWVLDSSIFRELQQSQVVWTGKELVSADGFAFNPTSGETRNVVSISESSAFSVDVAATTLQLVWSGDQLFAIGTVNVGVVDADFARITVLPEQPLIQYARTGVWTGKELLVVAGDSAAAVFDSADGGWRVVDGVPISSATGGWAKESGLAFLESLPYGLAVWDGTGAWKVLPPAELPAVGLYVPADTSTVASRGYVYWVGHELYRYPIPDLVDGVFPQPTYLPIGDEFLDTPEGWRVTNVSSNPEAFAEGRHTITAEILSSLGVSCKVASTSPGVNPYIPAFTQAATLVRIKDEVEFPVGETSSAADGLAHVVFGGFGVEDLVDVVCPDLGTARLLAAHLWNPGDLPDQPPPGVEGDTTCYVSAEVGTVPADQSSEIVVQLKLLSREPCEISGPLELQLVRLVGLASELPSSPPAVVFGETVTPDEPYLSVTYTMSNWCDEDRLAAVAVLGGEQRAALLDVPNPPCLDESQPATLERGELEGPFSTPVLQP